MELPTYTNIWRIEKRLYKLYDFRLPMPLPIGQIAVFAAIAVPYVVILKVIGLPFSHTLLWLYILPPAALAWLITRPVLEGKRLPELVVSQVRYLGEPRTWCRMAPLTEKEEITVVARVWRRPDLELVGVEATELVRVEATEVGSVEATEVGSVEPKRPRWAASKRLRCPSARRPNWPASRQASWPASRRRGGRRRSSGRPDGAVPPPAAAATSEVPDTPPPPVEHRPGRSALVRHLPTGPIPAWPKASSRASRLSGRATRQVPAPPPGKPLTRPPVPFPRRRGVTCSRRRGATCPCRRSGTSPPRQSGTSSARLPPRRPRHRCARCRSDRSKPSARCPRRPHRRAPRLRRPHRPRATPRPRRPAWSPHPAPRRPRRPGHGRW